MKHFLITLIMPLTFVLFPIKASAFTHLSPYSYCGSEPINYIDPTGCKIEGISKKDAAMVVADIRAMFPGDEFKDFRNLIVQSGKKQNGKSLETISQESLSEALEGVSLDEYQQALVDMVVNTINSDDVHKVEYLSEGEEMSNQSLGMYAPSLNDLGITSEMASNIPGGYTQFVLALCGEASTKQTSKGSLTLILKDSNAFISNRPATIGHEIIGHGRSYRLGFTDAQSQHVIPIQVENLILRNMGIQNYRNGTKHAPLNTYIPNFMAIPNFR